MRQDTADREAFWTALRARHPPLWLALREDARVTALHRGERHEFRSRWTRRRRSLRLAWVSDAFLAQALYRVKARLQALGVPVLPGSRTGWRWCWPRCRSATR